MKMTCRVAVLSVWTFANLVAQTTQGLISGSLVNSVTGQPIAGASVTYTSTALSATGTYKSDAAGYYFLPLLSPGTYSIRAIADGYQSQELQQLELAVAGRIQIEFKLRPLNDVWEAGQFRSVFLPGSKTIVTFYGPDVDTSRSGSFEGQTGLRGTLDTSMSYVIDPAQIADLPLQGRDVYTMLVSLPNVTADQGTARGLGISVAGQRPSSSNYLLDGVENDNYLITGPLNPVAPEAVQEYRISTNNYSAEFGRTSGFIANAVTKAGGNQFHGVGYEYLQNTGLNAADFADNLNGYGRLPDKQNQFGYQVGGPILHDRLFFSSALEQLISHSAQNPQTFVLPSTNFIPALNIPSSRLAYQLLNEFPGPQLNSLNLTTNYVVSPPVVVDRLLALERGDYLAKGGRDRFMVRLNIARVTEPDFSWSPYPAFISPLHQHTTGVAGNWMHTWTPRLTSELKLSYSDDDLWWNRAHPEIPTLVAGGTNGGPSVTLPGSPLFYAYQNHNRSLEAIYSAVWTRNRHVITAGVGLLFRFNSGYLTAGRDGEYGFSNIVSFAFDQPTLFAASVDRLDATPTQPDFNRSYSYTQSYFFVQDSFRVNSRLTLNYGLRYERYGAPQNTGAVKDALIQLGPGSNFNAVLASATLAIPGGSGNQQIFGADNGDWAPRFGFSFDPLGKGKTLLRGGFGIFYDRPFDNLWQNVRGNNLIVPFYSVPGTTNYLQPVATALASYANQTSALSAANSDSFTGLTLMDPKLRNAYAETFFVGVQQSVGDHLALEVNGTGSVGHRLITTDIVNRQFTTNSGDGRPNESFPDVYWRSGQGNSDYTALSTLVRYRLSTLQVQAAYTWSHAIDDQSDPLNGDFFNLDFTAISNSSGPGLRSSFSQMFNNNGDRGNSDFDQRQNLVLLGIWQPTSRRLLTRNWQVSWMAAFRSGLPFTVLSPTFGDNPPYGNSEVENQTANLILPPSAAFLATPQPAPGGKILLNSAAFAQPSTASADGNTSRNEFTGPGLYNIDLSVARSFSVPKLREGTRLTIRADAFNFLNHANLNNPNNLINQPVGAPVFGLATYGRQGTASGFPGVSPINETARQIQILLRLEF